VSNDCPMSDEAREALSAAEIKIAAMVQDKRARPRQHFTVDIDDPMDLDGAALPRYVVADIAAGAGVMKLRRQHQPVTPPPGSVRVNATGGS